MTSIQKKTRTLEKRRKEAALIGGGIGLLAGFLLSAGVLVTLFAGVGGSLTVWYYTSLSYWEYRDSMILKERRRRRSP